MRKKCAISAGKLLVLYYILNKLIKTIYSSCNKTVIYLLAGKYRLGQKQFLGQYHGIFPS